HARTNSAFYRERWVADSRLDAEAAFETLAGLPFVTKRDLQEHTARMRVDGASERITAKSTGGSTAEPVTVWKSASGMSEERAATWAALAWSGIKPSDRAARFWSTPLTSAAKRKFALADLAMNRIRLSAFENHEA